MARRSSKPEEEKDAGKPVEPTESMPEQDTEIPSEEDALQARSQNRETVIKYYNEISRKYDDTENKLDSAKYNEDEDDWNEPEDRRDEADSDDEDEDDEED